MSDESNVINLLERAGMVNPFKDDPRDEFLRLNREELLEALNGIKGRVASFDLRGLIIIGMGRDTAGDVTFVSTSVDADLPRAVGALEILKTTMAYDHIRDAEDDGYFD